MRVVIEALRGLYRAGSIGVLSVVTTAASLMLLGVFVHVIWGGYALADAIRSRAEVEVYMRDGLVRSKALRMVKELAEIPGVAEARYVGKLEAADEFREMFGSRMLDALSQNPLPASIRLRLAGEGDMTDLAQSVANRLTGRPEIEDVDAGTTWLRTLDRVLRLATWLAFALGTIVSVACALAVSNTIKLVVLGQRDAIEVMRLVGASGWHTRLTFVVGGVIQGCLGGLMAAVGLWWGSSWWSGWIPDLPPVSPFYPGLGVIAMGMLLGLLGSWTSLSRVLKAVGGR